MRSPIFALICIACMLFVSSCGRKQRTLFQFSTTTTTTISKLALPSVRSVRAESSENGAIKISWQRIENVEKLDSEGLIFQGYAVYKFKDHAFIPKKPYAVCKSGELNFVDTSQSSIGYRYALRPRFKRGKQEFTGPVTISAPIK